MTPEQIQAFIDAMARSDLTELEVHHAGWRLRLARAGAAGTAMPVARAPAGAPTSASPVSATSAAVVPAAGAAPAVPSSAPARTTAPHEVQAPLYGVVHLQAAPGAEPFVQPGQAVAVGQLLCSIEAMKVFNEVRAECAGTLQAVLVASGTEVEAGQALMRIAPSTDV
ncbi:acetyl-CoA carboxylase biotin carboxyl carrier protein [Pseudaquabacterium rugosum]|uniref:Biotin carboxyl carrier protein of acetyl-CoA carboxylase n=1 Tax=Pseudaquabacterium rugosum TaxID=2984194 RepID=A0ABU9BH29_9BURK